MAGKTCTGCNEHKEYTEFHKDRTQKDGYKKICKSCRSDVQRSYRQSRKVEEVPDDSMKLEELRREALTILVKNHRKEFIHIYATLKKRAGILPEWRPVHDLV